MEKAMPVKIGQPVGGFLSLQGIEGALAPDPARDQPYAVTRSDQPSSNSMRTNDEEKCKTRRRDAKGSRV